MNWQFEPGVVAGLSFLTLAYTLAATRYRDTLVRLGGDPPPWLPPGALTPERRGHLTPWQVLAFYTGIVVAAVALLSPLHPLGERYLLSAHMVQHLLVTLVVPPLLLLGTPGWMLRPLLRLPRVRSLAARLLAPIPAFALFNFVFVFWHAPILYETSLHFAPLHAVEHGLFLGLALLTWWPVFGPLPEFPRLPYGAQVMYLFFESLPPTVLGAIISLAQVPLYLTYWEAPRIPGFLGIFPGYPAHSPLEDQQLGGLIMWVPGALAYFLVLSVVWFLWLEKRGPRDDPPYGNTNPERALRK